MIEREKLQEVLYEPAMKLIKELENFKEELSLHEKIYLEKLKSSLRIYHMKKLDNDRNMTGNIPD